MPNPVLADLIAAAAAEHTVLVSAVTFITGVPALIADAVAKATANGATAAELAPLTDLVSAMKSDSKSITDALTANTPTPPSP